MRILHETTADDVEYVFGDSVGTLEQDGDGVNVTFERGGARRFDLVIGADGLRSLTRSLTIGEEGRFLHHLGHYVAAADVSKDMGVDGEVVLRDPPAAGRGRTGSDQVGLAARRCGEASDDAGRGTRSRRSPGLAPASPFSAGEIP
ncbi:hypothetical protein ACIBCT_31970 [Streptosporangium sp. NPDC050855]|uniref:hypothetical protein n=1 Tax=Streptosporangium sp. NPDC050855 TaxID=3366194 RepID=UPI0037BD8CB6